MKKILLLYYSQTGQLKNIADSIVQPLIEADDADITYCNYKPIKDYPFPWSSDQFFDVFPESVEGMPVDLAPLDIDPDTSYDLIILAYQVWYLSPSIPVWSLLNDKRYKNLFKGTKIVTVLGVRNMWVMAHRKLSAKLKSLGSEHVGNIVLHDPYPNLISVVTVIKWMLTGNQGPYKLFPRSGVLQKTIKQAGKYGEILLETIRNGNYAALQENLVNKGAVKVNFALKTTERNGIRIFGIWSKFILKKGSTGDPRRLGRVRLFKYYLMVLIFVLSPFASILFWLISMIFYPSVNKHLKKIALLRE